MKLKLARPLLTLLSEGGQDGRLENDTLVLAAGSWPQVVEEIRGGFPSLADHVFTEAGTVAAGFVLVVNGEVVQHGATPSSLREDDELALIAGLAGGCGDAW